MLTFGEIFQKNYPQLKWDEFTKLGQKLQKTIDYQFTNLELMWKALSIRGSKLPKEEFERIEYLGDGILSCLTSIILYDQRDLFQPEELTRYRSLLTDNNTLAEIARELGLEEFGKLLGIGIPSSNQASDTVEALIGAIFLDTERNFSSTFNVVKKIIQFETRLITIGNNPWGTKDPKSFLHEWVQKKYKNEAEIIFDDRNSGTANAPAFLVKAIIERKNDHKILFEGESVGPFSRKKDGEKDASKILLLKLNLQQLL